MNVWNFSFLHPPSSHQSGVNESESTIYTYICTERSKKHVKNTIVHTHAHTLIEWENEPKTKRNSFLTQRINFQRGFIGVVHENERIGVCLSACVFVIRFTLKHTQIQIQSCMAYVLIKAFYSLICDFYKSVVILFVVVVCFLLSVVTHSYTVCNTRQTRHGILRQKIMNRFFIILSTFSKIYAK